MIVLGLDTATSSSAAGLLLADGSTREARDDPRAGEHPGHATRLLGLSRELLDGASISWRDLERLAVGVGPGTFTGLRVGIATARALAQSLAIDLVGVSSLQALAHGALSATSATTHDAILAVIDARRGEVFVAAYERGEEGISRELTPPVAVKPERVGEVLQHASAPTPDPQRRWLAVGDGAVRYDTQLGDFALEIADEDSQLHRVSAAAICELASTLPAGDYGEIVPDYRRRPDAELKLESATAAGGGS
ncbi:MAG: tRNA (adenosine(37)-N6)-threonylcarbamoyltransferase complex dimerization subunit type 1 TsaB [Solirubrobacteraceae bacterium]